MKYFSIDRGWFQNILTEDILVFLGGIKHPPMIYMKLLKHSPSVFLCITEVLVANKETKLYLLAFASRVTDKHH